LQPVRQRKNLEVRTKCQVKRIVFENKTAIGVEVAGANGIVEIIRCNREVLLCAGAIQSPQVLLLSGVGDPVDLQQLRIHVVHGLPGVGKNLQDHVWSGVSGCANIPTANSVLRPLNQVKAVLQHLLFKKGLLCNSPLEANAFIKSQIALSRPDIQFHFVPVGVANDYSTDIHDLKTFSSIDGFSIMVVLIRPQSTGTVTLQSANFNDPPLINPNVLSAQKEIDTLLFGMKKAIEVLTAAPLRKYCPGGVSFPKAHGTDADLIEHARRSLETLYHPVGTCKMGNDSMAVTDAALRVHGVQRLRVVDASIMPTIVSGNTNAATIMIAEKAADIML
jgi:choline dehydrogenase